MKEYNLIGLYVHYPMIGWIRVIDQQGNYLIAENDKNLIAVQKSAIAKPKQNDKQRNMEFADA